MGEEVEFINFGDVPVGCSVFSIYEDQILELAEIRNPSLSKDELTASLIDKLKAEIKPIQIYFPWKKLVLETVPEDIFLEIKTNRNQLLITSEEQKKIYYEGFVSIAGLSVGGSILYGLVGTGISRNIIISDYDTFSNSNLNRVQATVFDISQNKAAVAKRRALEMNPFLNITIITEPISDVNISEFITEDTGLIFEEIDDFKMKVALRKYAKSHNKAFVMLTNLGDGVLIDIERHDKQNTDIFNGFVGEEIINEIESCVEVDINLMKSLSVNLVDQTMISDRAMKTLNEIGKTLVGRPQLYNTVALDGGIAPYIARRILLDQGPESGRYKVDLKVALNNES